MVHNPEVFYLSVFSFVCLYVCMYVSMSVCPVCLNKNIFTTFQDAVTININPAQPATTTDRRRRKILHVNDVIWAKYGNWDILPGIITSNTGKGKVRVKFFDGMDNKYSIPIKKFYPYNSRDQNQLYAQVKNKEMFSQYIQTPTMPL